MTDIGQPKVVVTGATGYIGSYLIGDLRSRGYRVLALTRGAAQPATDHVTWQTYEGLTESNLDGVSTVFHLAGRAHVFRDREPDPAAAFHAANVDLTVNLAERAARAGVRRFVFVSSIAVLGSGTAPGSRFSERTSPQPDTEYGRSKLAAEQRVLALGQSSGMEVVVVRPPMVYGRGAKGNYARLVAALSRGIPLPLGATANKRSFIGVGNLSDFLILCAEHPAASGKTFLISDNHDISTTHFLKLSAEALGVKPNLVATPPAFIRLAAKIVRREALAEKLVGNLEIDCNHAESLLSWTPPFTLAEGMLQPPVPGQGERHS